MKRNDLIKTIIFTIIVGILVLVLGFNKKSNEYATKLYQVYLNGNKLGMVSDSDALYALIDEEQSDIKNTYKVDTVYPPNGFAIEEVQTYDGEVLSETEIYEKMKDEDDFTIEGYIVKIKSDDTSREDITLYVLNEDIFKTALMNFITAFVTEEEYNNYVNNTQEAIDDVGTIIEDMYFKETITIKEAHISVNEDIYTDATELTQYLLFGTNKEQTSYKVKSGDTIASISEENKLNPQEFLIANTKYRSQDSILKIGDVVNITLINPVLTLVESIYSIEDEEQVYESETVYDSSLPVSFEEVTQTGITGIVRTTKKTQIVNGEQNQGVDTISTVTIRETQNEITTKGGTKPSGYYYNIGGSWGWPTNRPYVITSGFEWRWGSFHNAIDISGTGFGSPIYASRDGVVVDTNDTCANVGYYRSQCGNTYGNYIVIQHSNNYYTMYAHLISDLEVNVGDTVTRGTIIGYMGSSGSSTGAHLHFGVSIGEPDRGTWLNPWSLFR